MLRHQLNRRRGSAYIIVLAASLLVAVIGVSALLGARVEHRAARGATDAGVARQYARSAINLALHKINEDSSWRTTYGNGNWPTGKSIGHGSYTISAVDPVDGNVTSGQLDPVIITGLGRAGVAVQKIEVTLEEDAPPLAVLGTALHSTQQVFVDPSATATFYGGVLSTSDINNMGTVYGDIEAVNVTAAGTIIGALSSPVPVPEMPPNSVIARYQSEATPISNPGLIDKQVISPGSNPWAGGTDIDGAYFINTGGGNLTIRNSRIHGTLVVYCGAGKVIIDGPVLMEPYSSAFPALIVNGNLELRMPSGAQELSEAEWSPNFNPASPPGEGSRDADQAEDYPIAIRGLVHVKGNVLMSESARVRGTILCDGYATFEMGASIIHDPALAQDPPVVQSADPPMKIAPGSWKQAVD
jgi:hypothetical protein